MKVTDEIRTHARVWYGPRADDYLAAIRRIKPSTKPGVWRYATSTAFPIFIERDFSDLLTIQSGGAWGPGALMAPKRARDAALCIAAMADAIEFGWLLKESAERSSPVRLMCPEHGELRSAPVKFKSPGGEWQDRCPVTVPCGKWRDSHKAKHDVCFNELERKA